MMATAAVAIAVKCILISEVMNSARGKLTVELKMSKSLDD